MKTVLVAVELSESVYDALVARAEQLNSAIGGAVELFNVESLVALGAEAVADGEFEINEKIAEQDAVSAAVAASGPEEGTQN